MPILASDNFTRANENPLNPTNWTTVTGQNALQIVANLCEPTALAAQSRELFTNATWPNDQYSLVTINLLTNGVTTDFVQIFARASTATQANHYRIQIAGAASGNQTWQVLRGASGFNTPQVLGSPVVSGDKFALKIIGTTLTAYRNGVSLGSFTDSTFASGTPGLGAQDVTTLSNVNMSYWEGGSIVTTADPTASPNGGAFGPAQTITLNDATAGTTIYYTTDGSTPTIPATGTTQTVAAGGTITISSTSTLKMIALSNGAFDTQSSEVDVSFTINGAVATPTFSPVAGSYGPSQSVTINDTNSGLPGFAMTYTTDGSTPIPGSHGTVYSGPITVSSTQTIKVIASATNYSNSAEADATYTINGAAATPQASPAGGTYSSAQSVTLTCSTPSSSIFYTTDGSTPTSGSTPFTVPILISANTTLKSIATASGFSNSAVDTEVYVIGGGGAVGWSPVDSRQAVKGQGPGPNTGVVDAQGNTIYSAQKPPFTGNSQVSDNSAIPPTDSRAAGAPVDSRVNKPVNSRTAPPFKS